MQRTPEVNESKPQAATKLKVVLFSGGSGTQSITDAFLKHPQLDLTILINAYDDGHSTGRLRQFITGMLGPSDVRKNINRLMPRHEQCYRALRQLSDYRLPVGMPYDQGMAELQRWCEGDFSKLPCGKLYHDLTVRQAKGLVSFCRTFQQHCREQELTGRRFDFNDCAIGNILFAGCYLEAGQDFNRAMDSFARFYDVSAKLMNITRGENLFLIATKEDGTLLRSEGEIVAVHSSTSKIDRLYLLEEEPYRQRIENGAAQDPEEIQRILAGHVTPQINAEAEAAIRSADVIIYGPGTQHSSLFPSYLTEGVGEAIRANPAADKIFVANIRRDYDIQVDNANDLARKLLASMRRAGVAGKENSTLEWREVVTHFFFQQSGGGEREGYVPFDAANFHFPLETVKLRDWEAGEGKHAGGYVLDELQQIVQSRIQIQLASPRHLVSIIVPALDEERTVVDTLKALTALDFTSLGLSQEVLLIDGGSTDATVEKAKSVRGVRVFSVTGSQRGRGVALRQGMEHARGDLTVFFPADAEYNPKDLYAVINALVQQKDVRMVFGTRAVRWADPDERLHQVYGKSKLLYMLSKYGGMALSTLTLFLYNRYMSDTLTSLKAGDARLLKSLALESNGVDLDMELFAKLSKRRQYILEVPVDYRPRSRAEGKKTTMLDGLKAIFALIRFRFGKA